MSRAGIGVLRGRGEAHLTRGEIEDRMRDKWVEIERAGLLPDWFTSGTGRDLCLPPRMRVAVIGGGFAGTAAAWYLTQCGVHVTLYEAAEHVGGRVRTDRGFVGAGLVEAGAELIGENHAMWNVLARRLRLPLVPITTDDEYENGTPPLDVRLIFGGTPLTPAEKATLFANLETAFKEIGDDARPIPPRAPWLAADAARLDAMSVSDKLDQMLGLVSSHERRWFEYTLGNDNCADVGSQSYLGLLALVSAGRMGDDDKGMRGYWDCTETHRCRPGNQALASALAATVADVRLNQTVVQVQIEHIYLPPVRVHSRPTGGGPVTYEDYDFAILTPPPSVWGAIRFRPAISPGRAMQHGAAVKYLSRYNSAFWRSVGLAPSTKDDAVGSVWEGTDKQPSVQQFDLTIFSGGSLVKPAAQYPGLLAGLYPTGTPTGDMFVDWPNEPGIMTGYAVPDVGQVTTVAPMQLRPHHRRLYFAGEQTSIGFFGYMEGALQSGARAARDIVVRWAEPCDGMLA